MGRFGVKQGMVRTAGWRTLGFANLVFVEAAAIESAEVSDIHHSALTASSICRVITR